MKVNKIKPQEVEIFDPSDNSLGFVNEYEFNDFRIQIKEYEAEGYYAMFNGHRINIDKDGGINDWIDGFFDLFQIQLSKILCL